ncbi:MAG TPA: AMP-binding protein, partial [Candidatus Limnocylindrales bacterium]
MSSTPMDAAVEAPPRVLWSPPPGVLEHSNMGQYVTWLGAHRGRRFDGYDALWRWSVDEPGAFWQSIADHFQVAWHDEPATALENASMPGARWFPGATLNYAEHALRMPGRDANDVVVVGRSQTRAPADLTATQLRDAVAQCRAGLVRLGVGRGDRVAAFLPNIPEAIVALLATASLGATWSSCAPEFGVRAVIDRFGQIEPKVLLAIDGYRYGDKDVDRRAELAEIRAALPSLAATVVIPYLDPSAGRAIDGATAWDDLLGTHASMAYEAVPFDHPLYILYSSGTTGLPKPIVHGHGGILLEHLKALGLHTDLGPADRFLWFTTTGWMMWN